MGTQFWWFFDIASAAILMITMFLSGKKGFAKTVAVMTGYVIAIVLGVSVSGSAANFIYKNGVRQSNISGIEKALETNDFAQKTKSYIETLGYNVNVKESVVEDIFKDGGDINNELYNYVCNINGRTVDTREDFYDKMTSGFADITASILSQELTGYEAEKAAGIVRENAENFSETLLVIYGGDLRAAAVHIEENYTGEASLDIIKIFCFIIIIFVFMTLVKAVTSKLNVFNTIKPVGDIADNVIGVVFGAAEGFILIFIIALAVRACVILSSDGILLFNSNTIDKTIFFKHIYNLVLKL